jgi:hypothetical protein
MASAPALERGASAPFRLGTSTETHQARQRPRHFDHQFCGVGELRQQPRRHEGADLDLAFSPAA